MSSSVGSYLDVASDKKGRIRKTSRHCLGVTFISNQTRTVLSFALAILAVTFGSMVAGLEVYSGNTKKPWQVTVYDVMVEVTLFSLILPESL